LSSKGRGFVFMFGWDVNKTMKEDGAPQVELDVEGGGSKEVPKAGGEGGGVVDTAVGQGDRKPPKGVLSWWR
jgi:hypothetical protein